MAKSHLCTIFNIGTHYMPEAELDAHFVNEKHDKTT